MVPQNGWFTMKNPIKMDDLGGKKPYFWVATHIGDPIRQEGLDNLNFYQKRRCTTQHATEKIFKDVLTLAPHNCSVFFNPSQVIHFTNFESGNV